MYYGLIEMKKTELEEWNEILSKGDLLTIDAITKSMTKSMFSTGSSIMVGSTPQTGMSIGGVSSGSYTGKIGSLYGMSVINTELIKKNKNNNEADKWKEIFKKRQEKLDNTFPITVLDKYYKGILQKLLDNINGDTNASE